jgi:hypothetical protein
MSAPSGSRISALKPRNEWVRRIEKKARVRKHDSLAALHNAIISLPADYYDDFIRQVGGPSVHGGRLAQWQIISIAASAITYVLRLINNLTRLIAVT